MARPQPLPSMDSLVGIDAKMAALAKLELLQEEVDAALARKKSNGFLRRAIKAWRRGDITRAGQLALTSTGTARSECGAMPTRSVVRSRPCRRKDSRMASSLSSSAAKRRCAGSSGAPSKPARI